MHYRKLGICLQILMFSLLFCLVQSQHKEQHALLYHSKSWSGLDLQLEEGAVAPQLRLTLQMTSYNPMTTNKLQFSCY